MSSLTTAIGRAAWYAAWAGVVLGPLHALSRYATADGRPDLDSGPERWWAEPAAARLEPLLSWSDPQTVYLTYGKGWFPVLVVTTAAAFLIRRTRHPYGLERVGWPVALAGLVLITASTFGDFYTPWIDESFAYVGIPGMLVGIVGFALLGVALIRRGFRPRATGWLLLAWLPLLLAISEVLAQGTALLPILFAWGLAGRAAAARTENHTQSWLRFGELGESARS